MKGKGLLLVGVICLALIMAALPFMAACAKPAPAPAETPEDFYKGKLIELVIPYSPGGGFDTMARLVAPWLTKYTGADVVVRNKTGGGGLTASNYMYEKAERDGTSLYFCLAGTSTIAQLVERKEVHFDFTKFIYLANLGTANQVCYISAELPYESLDEMKASGKTFNFAASTMEANPGFIPAIILADYGIKVNVVLGYKGAADYIVAILRGECDAAVNAYPTALAQYKEGNLRPLFVLTRERLPYAPEIPTIYEAAEFSGEAKLWVDLLVDLINCGHRLMLTAPDVPKDRVAFLKDVFKKIMTEKKLIGRLETLKLDPSYMPGEEAEQVVKAWFKLPADKVERFRRIVVGE